jgi:predicted DCC family thiol-disulfide oxidoreductase YuxK
LRAVENIGHNKSPVVRTIAHGDEPGPDALMVFDGLCNFCSAQVQLILRIDRAGAIRFTSIQSPYGRHLAARFGIDPDDPSTFLFFDHGRPREASDAVIAMLGRLPRPWRWLRALRILPRFMRDALYRLVARNRYRLLGKRDSCMIPAPHVRARFIDEIPTDAR